MSRNRESAWTYCPGCGAVIRAIDIKCTPCEMQEMSERIRAQYTLAPKRPGQSLGNRRA